MGYIIYARQLMAAALSITRSTAESHDELLLIPGSVEGVLPVVVGGAGDVQAGAGQAGGVVTGQRPGPNQRQYRTSDIRYN